MSREVDRADRDAEALRLRRQGLDYREIARHVGVSVSTAHDRVHRALKQIPADDIEQLRTLEDQRLDTLLVAAFGVMNAAPPEITVPAGMDAAEGQRWTDRAVKAVVDSRLIQLRAAETVLKIEESRRKLFGLDAPPRTEDTAPSFQILIDPRTISPPTRLPGSLPPALPPAVDPLEQQVFGTWER